MKKLTAAFVSTAMLTAILAGCAGGPSSAGTSKPADTAVSTAGKKAVTIKMFQFKVEIAEALHKLAEEYKKETGVTVEIETHGGGEDYNALLKAEIASGSEPEIFNNGGFVGLEPYMDRAEDLTNEPWAKDLVEISKRPTTVNGKLYGMPMNIEGYGLIYNKELFAKAGITAEPKTFAELKEAAEKLKAAGITPFMATNEWWSLGLHTVNIALANQPDPQQFISDLSAGQTTIKGNPVFVKWLDFVDLLFANSQKDKTTTDYTSQITHFASGKAAMMLQGNWTQGDVNKVNPNMKLGVLPLPIDDKEGSVMVGVASNYIVNKKSKHPEEAKAFLNWLVTSETGKNFVAKEFKFIPAVNTVKATAEDIGQIAVEIQNKAGSAKGWNWDLFPDGVTQGLGAAMQEYMGGGINREQLLEKLDKAVQDIVKK
ncbi:MULTISPECIES: ABC transporter substrate-binding protein [Paenibacillus]|uniref:ABC transporter substrate-binding protein n=1 Tax=Paenibacillus TaxID=44249 RepID=UPI0022B89F2D|nr:extracellular solute-binding protein [Paenibacillus caseinilyticus]MCZ8518308.1 extracellular solute-binding protein [Paenibacillus caseinilyticus]